MVVAGLLISPFALLQWWVGAPSGDLTRLGAWPERDFAWTAPQPQMPVYANRDATGRADILVLGDSFSVGNVWQSEVQRRTSRVTLTYSFDQAGSVDAFVGAALAVPSAQAPIVIVQTIERDFLRWFEVAGPVPPYPIAPIDNPVGSTHAFPLPGPAGIDARHLARTAVHALRHARPGAPAVVDAEVVNAPLTDRTLFTHARSDRLLYYRADDNKSQWTDAQIGRAIARLRAIQQQLARHGQRLVVVVVPDKSSVYADHVAGPLRPAGSRGLPARLAQAGVAAIDLLPAMTTSIRSVPDLYMPNDTHLSAAGFRLLGEQVSAWLQAERFARP